MADVGYRIDGGPAMADIDAFLIDLADALRARRDERPMVFHVGSHAFDPVHVGFAFEDDRFSAFYAADDSG